jgi:hypothetical protein
VSSAHGEREPVANVSGPTGKEEEDDQDERKEVLPVTTGQDYAATAMPVQDPTPEERMLAEVEKIKAMLALAERIRKPGEDKDFDWAVMWLRSLHSRSLGAVDEFMEAYKTFRKALSDENKHERWKRFNTMLQEGRERLEEEGRARDQADQKAAARQKAKTAVEKELHGAPKIASGVVGMTFAAVSDGQGVWTGRSAHRSILNKVMGHLLDHVTKAQSWDPNVCAEVDAMNKYLDAHKEITKITDIPGGVLHFHAVKWDTSIFIGGTKKVKQRPPCENCAQWIAAIGATYS